MMFTGHYNGEESFTSVRNNVGDLMMQLRNMQQPGMDHLGLHIDGALNAIRSISSVANQYGITRRLSEAYGVSGQNMNFEDRAWIASWHTLNGVNHLCPHLALYSMKGTRKRDYPPTLSSQQPYWKYNKLLEDLTSRLCYMSTIGKYAPELLVVHPLESEFIEGGIELRSGSVRNSKYMDILETLQENHRDYDLGDEQIIAEVGAVKANSFIVGQQTYKAVILPYMLTIRQSTVDLLKQFSGNGGKIIALEMPVYIDGVKDEKKLSELKSMVTLVNSDEFPSTIATNVIPEVTVTGDNAKNVWISHRLSENKHVLQITNTSRMISILCKVKFADKSTNIVLLDPAYGKSYSLVYNDGYELLLHPAQSYILTDKKLVTGIVSSGSYTIPSGEEKILTLSGDWNGKRQDVNAITLDFARYSTDNGKTFSRPEPVLGIHERLTKSRYNGPLVLIFDFKTDFLPSTCNLVLEQPEMYSKIEINGKSVKFNSDEFYRDISFKTKTLDGMLENGSNTISLFLDYKAPGSDNSNPYGRYGSEIESIYLTGDFAVKTGESKLPSDLSQHNARGFLIPKPVHHFNSFTLTKEKTTFSGDLVPQGYPFYNGGFVLEKSFELSSIDPDKKYILKFPLSESIIIKVNINGTDLSPVAWSPWEVDITNVIKRGTNSVTITMINSLRNLLGPHHNAESELIAVSPGSFTGAGTWTTNLVGEDDWYELRLQGTDKTSIWRDDYCMIGFGLLEDAEIVVRDK